MAGQTLIVQSVFDEAGDTGSSGYSSRYLVVAGIVCASLEPLRRLVARTRKTLGKKLRNVPELKARHSTPRLTAQFLGRIAELDIEIFAAGLDKRAVPRPQDPEDWYRRAYAEAVRQALAHHEQITLTMDNRYTKAALRDKLVQFIAAYSQRSGTALTFVYADSHRERARQAADAVAWSFFQKYERGDESFYRLIAGKVKGEILLLQ
ncbi:MAG: DUF3800 domain-containing protein [Chloroflexi bacterium]|nr:DUF3800 domain-containing protein [Chloroflexota bacterium]